MNKIRVKKVQSVSNLENVVNTTVEILENENMRIEDIRFIDEYVAFIIYKKPIKGKYADLSENILKAEVSG